MNATPGSEATYAIGSEVHGEDGPCGKLTRVVMDPVARRVTHLIVLPRGEEGPGRLVPISLAEPAADRIRLRCPVAKFQAMDPAEERWFVPHSDTGRTYHDEQVIAWPFYGIGLGGIGRAFGAMPPDPELDPEILTISRVPAGEVQVRRGERVHAVDGDIGRVQGLLVDPADDHVTHVLLDEGHLWGKKRVAIPIGAVVGVKGGVDLSLTKEQVRHLPALEPDDES